MIPVRLYDRISDLDHGVGECVERRKRITQVGDSTEQALNRRKECTRRTRNAKSSWQILSRRIGKSLTNGILKVSNAAGGQHEACRSRIANRLLRITSRDAVPFRWRPVDLNITLVGIVENALGIKQGIAGRGQWVQRRTNDVNRGRAQSESRGS